jgi:NDP-mannose synthase
MSTPALDLDRALADSARTAARLEPATRRAVILAGGRGTRLAPYTSVLPKPLMPIGNQSILEIVIGQLADHGITEVTLCVGYLSHLIRAVLDHADLPVDVTYVHEEEALGTAGPLRLIDRLDDTFIVMNGDVLSTIDYQDLAYAHRESGNLVTVAARRRTIKIDYGVLQLLENGASTHAVTGWTEKPEMTSYVSMGIYLVEPQALELIPDEEYYDFPTLVQALLDKGLPVGAYAFDGTWFDIGRHDDYEQAAAAWANVTPIGTRRRRSR